MLNAIKRAKSAILSKLGNPNLPGGFVLSDPKRTPDIIQLASNLPEGTGLIYRHYGADDRFEVAARLKAISKHRNLVFLISYDPDLQAAIRPNGVHYPKRMLTCIQQRQNSQNLIQTASAHTRRQASKAFIAGADACLVSSVFPSRSPSAPLAMGVHRFRAIARGLAKPVYALGGVTNENVEQLNGSYGIAMVEGSLSF